MKHVMIDLETLGTRPGCAVFELAAMQFDLVTGDIGRMFHKNIKPNNGRIEPETEAWHRSQGTYPSADQGERWDAGDALALFGKWYWDLGEVTAVWSWGASFDFPILQSLWDSCGMFSELPWRYHQAQCARTVWKLAFPELRHEARPHKALADCRAAVRDLVKAVGKLKGRVPSDR